MSPHTFVVLVTHHTHHRKHQPSLMTLEHDYIGLSEVSPTAMHDGGTLLGSLKETELRLGLPGSESPERVEKAVLSLGLPKGSSSYTSSGAKRGYSDAINGTGKWVFSTGGNGSEPELGMTGGGLFSPTGMGENGGGGAVLKDAGLGTKVGDLDKKKKGHVSAVGLAPAAKAQVVGWPPIRSYRKNTMATNSSKNNDEVKEKQGSGCFYVKVSMDGAPYLRKVDLKMHSDYKKLSSGLEKMFSCFTIGHCGSHGLAGKDDGLNDSSRLTDILQGSEYVLTYEDKDGDWMLVGDVPWDMFTETCKRLRIMKGSNAVGLAPRATTEKFHKTVKT